MAEQSYRFGDWFVHNWSRVALPAGVVLIALTPLVYAANGLIGTVIYLQLASYMIHQYEEHAEGKFKALVNKLLAHGEPKITDLAIFLVNIIGVWGIYLLVIDGMLLVAQPLGLIVAYTTLVNAILHILTSVIRRAYNPGLVTSIILFLPLSITSIYLISPLPETTMGYQGLGIAVAIIIHVVRFGYLGALARR